MVRTLLERLSTSNCMMIYGAHCFLEALCLLFAMPADLFVYFGVLSNKQ